MFNKSEEKFIFRICKLNHFFIEIFIYFIVRKINLIKKNDFIVK